VLAQHWSDSAVPALTRSTGPIFIPLLAQILDASSYWLPSIRLQLKFLKVIDVQVDPPTVFGQCAPK